MKFSVERGTDGRETEVKLAHHQGDACTKKREKGSRSGNQITAKIFIFNIVSYTIIMYC
jgi:hypothetical protein